MVDLWNDAEARDFCERYQDAGSDLALRVYTSRLLGRDPRLVLHGGGNTSVKTRQRDLFGREVEVLCVKGSGWDLVDIEPPGLPAVRLDVLRELRQLKDLSDDDMVNAVRGALLDSRAPNPSVEALLHAFLPQAFVDHTHANAILALTDQPDPDHHVLEALGSTVLVLPWIMPGFPLAKAVADAFEQNPDCTGIVLAKHGLFTFGDTAEESYRRTVTLVGLADSYIEQRLGGVPAMLQGAAKPLSSEERVAALAEVLPALRGACAQHACAQHTAAVGSDSVVRVIADASTSDDLAAFGMNAGAAALCATNPITPDHVIRTKGHYLHLAQDDWQSADRIFELVGEYEAGYRRYYEASARCISPDHMHPAKPIVVVLAGVGLVALHHNAKAARIAADIAEHTIRVKAAAQALGQYVALADGELAEMEYWPLELKKLGKQQAPELAGQVALVTGAAGAIGAGIAEVLLEQGACVFATDIDAARLGVLSQRLSAPPGHFVTHVADVTSPKEVEYLFAACASRFGGVDCVVPNAGVAHVQSIDEMDHAAFARVMDVNATATMLLLKEAARLFKRQRTGGSVVLQASKNVFAPGARFGAYSASKAAALQLGRIAAMEFAELSVRVNMINADAVFGDEEVPSQLWEDVGPDRMRARGLDEHQLREYYRDRSLLKQQVTPRHVGEAVAWFASLRTPTTGAVFPVDGGLPEAFPR
jgi:rhamnose utilization protein RhaD (predicted bifunctional aldolase and dehydrogenase)/NAD(P)-dependent dehydrogenase (short-subunit alcohol dehydrogenase family)